MAAEAELKAPFADELPSRKEQLDALQNTQEFDVLVVGGGATGVGCALDAVTRSEFPVWELMEPWAPLIFSAAAVGSSVAAPLG